MKICSGGFLFCRPEQQESSQTKAVFCSPCVAMRLFGSHPLLCTLQLSDSSCSPGSSRRWDCHSEGCTPDRTCLHPGSCPPLDESRDTYRGESSAGGEGPGCHSPSHWYSPISTMPCGHSQMNPIRRSRQWWEQPPLSTAHSFWSADNGNYSSTTYKHSEVKIQQQLPGFQQHTELCQWPLHHGCMAPYGILVSGTARHQGEAS